MMVFYFNRNQKVHCTLIWTIHYLNYIPLKIYNQLITKYEQNPIHKINSSKKTKNSARSAGNHLMIFKKQEFININAK